MDNQAMNGEIMEVQSSERKSPLFYAPFFRDWTVLLGLVGVLAGSISTASGYGYYMDFGSSDWAALSIDLLFMTIVQGLVFGVLPASVRRRRVSKSASGDAGRTSLPTSMFWGLALLVATATTGAIVVQESQRSVSRAAIVEKCVPRGADNLCVSSQFLDDDQIRLSYQWKYARAQSVEGLVVGSISWFILLNCLYETRTVYGLSAQDPSGVDVDISETARELMTAGLESDDATSAVAQCKLLEE